MVEMDQAAARPGIYRPRRGQDISDKIGMLYAPPGAWSHGFLWGADVVEIPDGAKFNPDDQAMSGRSGTRPVASNGRRNAAAFALEVDSPTAVRTLNALLKSGQTAQLATAPFTNALG